MTDIVTEESRSQDTAALTPVPAESDTADLTPPPAESDDDEEEDTKNKTGKSRRELPVGAVATLKAWMLSPEHFTHPYPTPQDQELLMKQTGIDKKQLKNWFTNARRRIWKPMLKKRLEHEKLAQTGSGVGPMMLPPNAAPGFISASPAVTDYHHPTMSGTSTDPSNSNMRMIQHNYQHTLQPPQTSQQHFDASFGNNTTFGQQSPYHMVHNGSPFSRQNNNNFKMLQQAPFGQQQECSDALNQRTPIVSQTPLSGQIGKHLPQGNLSNLSKTDSHAILMELFARDQDLVRQATEGAKQGAMPVTATQISGGTDSSSLMRQQGVNGFYNYGAEQQQNKVPSNQMTGTPTSSGGSVNRLNSVLTLNSLPHFSSASSLNNLTMSGVKNITNRSGPELASMGSLNKKGNLAQVKSMESMVSMPWLNDFHCIYRGIVT